MLRSRLLALAAVLALGACGSVRTELPATVEPAPPLQQGSAEPTTVAPEGVVEPPTTELAVQPAITASPYKSPGEKHPLGDGTLAASYPRVGVRTPQGVEPPPPGQAWAVVNVRFCAGANPIEGVLVDPSRFRVEVPGQGEVAPAPGAPALARLLLAPGGPGVAPGACLEGSIGYLIAGEGHIESITYDSGRGLLRWAT